MTVQLNEDYTNYTDDALERCFQIHTKRLEDLDRGITNLEAQLRAKNAAARMRRTESIAIATEQARRIRVMQKDRSA